MKGDREKYLMAGMADYVPKPIDIGGPSNAVKKVTRIQRVCKEIEHIMRFWRSQVLVSRRQNPYGFKIT